MNELSRHIEILLLDNECVIVPGFGGFMAHYRAAEYIEEVGMFYPPQRTLGFNPQLQLNDSLLAQAYVEAYDISYPEAVQRIDSEVEDIRQTIAAEGSYEFHGIGIIKLCTTGIYDFEPCTAGLLTPELYALNSFNFDKIEKSDIIAEVKTGTHHVSRYEEGSGNCPTTSTKEPETTEPVHNNTIEIRLHTLRNILAAAMVLLLFVFSSIPVGIGSNRFITCSVIDTEFLTSFMQNNNYVGTLANVIINKDKAKIVTDNTKSNTLTTRNVANTDGAIEGYTIVLASKVSKKGAEAFIANLHKAGYKEARIYERGTMRKVIYGRYASETAAQENLHALRESDNMFADAWISHN